MEQLEKKGESIYHILNTSSNLLGLCFFIVMYLKTAGIAKSTIMDELVGFDALVFASCCLFSFLSMRSLNRAKSEGYELVADFLFFFGILSLVGIIVAGWLSFF
jgi:multisubunit Na+/H+ antiporter MnhF subunit